MRYEFIPKPDFKILDGLRGIAACYVVINHARGNLLIGGAAYAASNPISNWDWTEILYYSALQLTALGREFVIIFFVLSGFSIAHSLNYTTSLSKFYQRRAIRLYPPYLTALFWAYIVFVFISTAAPALVTGQSSVFANAAYAISNLFYIPKGALIGQFWSLTHEVIFYLLIAIAITKLRWYYIISAALYIVGWIINPVSVSSISILTAFIFDYNIYFALGIFLYFNYQKFQNYFLVNKLKLTVISIVLIIFMAVIKFATNEENKITLVIAGLLSLFLIYNFQDKKISNKGLAFLGMMSYTLYITHVASVFLFKSILLQTGIISSVIITAKWVWIAGVFFSIFISYLIYLISEKPTKRVLDYLRIRDKQKSAPVNRLTKLN